MQARQFPSYALASIFPSSLQASFCCFVTFEYGAGFPSFVLEVMPGSKIAEPATPQRDGYRFSGWFFDCTLSLAWSFDQIVSSDNITLYAKWVTVSFTIDYFINGGINAPQNPTQYTVEDSDIVLQKPSRGEDEFIAWYEDPMYSTLPTEIIRTNEARNIILYARFLTRQKRATAMEIVARDLYEGDPKLYLTPDGANLRYEGGQPVMEQGLENHAYIALFTRQDWCGNLFLPHKNRVGSDFEKTCTGSITLKKLADIEDAAVRALNGNTFPFVNATVRNPKSDNLHIDITVQGGTALSLTREGALWKNQRERP